MIFFILIIIAAFGGLWISHHIWKTKRMRKHLVCPVGFNCDAVVQSRYGTLLGIPLEVLGMFYYGGIAIVYGIFLAFPTAIPAALITAVLMSTAASFLFTIYLAIVQFMIIREHCSWCIASYGFSIIIFLSAILAL